MLSDLSKCDNERRTVRKAASTSALLGVWRLSRLLQHGVDACWFLARYRHVTKKKKRLPVPKLPQLM